MGGPVGILDSFDLVVRVRSEGTLYHLNAHRDKSP